MRRTIALPALLLAAASTAAPVARISNVNIDYVPEYAAQAPDGSWWAIGDGASRDVLVGYRADGTRGSGATTAPNSYALYGMRDGGVLRSTSLERCDLERHDPDGTLRWSHRGRGQNCFQVASDAANNTWIYSQTAPISKYFARVDRNGTLRLDSEIVQLGFELAQSFAGDPVRAGLIVGGTRGNTPALASFSQDVTVRWTWLLPGNQQGAIVRTSVAPDGSIMGVGRVLRENSALLLDVSLAPDGTARRFGIHEGIAADQVVAQADGGDGSNWVVTANDAGLKRLSRIGADGTTWSTPEAEMVCDAESPCTLRAAGGGEVWQVGATDGTQRTSFLRRWAADGRLVLDRSWPNTKHSLAAVSVNGWAVLISRVGFALRRFVTVPRDGVESSLPTTRGPVDTSLRLTGAALDGEGGTYAAVVASDGAGGALVRLDAEGRQRWRAGEDQGWYSTNTPVTNGVRVCVAAIYGVNVPATSFVGRLDCFRASDGTYIYSTTLDGGLPQVMRVLPDGRVLAWFNGNSIIGNGLWLAELDGGGTLVRQVRIGSSGITDGIADDAGNIEVIAGNVYLRADGQGQLTFGPFSSSEIGMDSLARAGDVAIIGGSTSFGSSLGIASAISVLPDNRLGWSRRFDERGVANVRVLDGNAWAATTRRAAAGNASLEPTVVHGIAPGTGESRWRRDELLPVDVESVLTVDATTRAPMLVQGWPGRVRQLLLDGATGAVRRETFVSHGGRGANVALATTLADGSVRTAFSTVGGTDRAAYVATTPAGAATTGFAPAGQPGIAGAWYPVNAAGQGIVIDWIASSRTLFAPWFTYTSTATTTNEPAQQRWYSLQGTVPADATRAELAIYENTGGNFDAAPATTARRVGTASLEFPSCGQATLRYRFDAGTPVVGDGAIALTRLTPRYFACRDADGSLAEAQGAASAGGFEIRQSGAWFAPATSGQGVMLTVVPGDSLFGAWFTYDAAERSDDPTRQSWVTLQAGLAAATGGRVTVPLYRTAGGTFDAAKTTPASTWQVGEATLSFLSCDRARLDYRFDDVEAAAPQRAKTGSIALERLGGCVD